MINQIAITLFALRGSAKSVITIWLVKMSGITLKIALSFQYSVYGAFVIANDYFRKL